MFAETERKRHEVPRLELLLISVIEVLDTICHFHFLSAINFSEIQESIVCFQIKWFTVKTYMSVR